MANPFTNPFWCSQHRLMRWLVTPKYIRCHEVYWPTYRRKEFWSYPKDGSPLNTGGDDEERNAIYARRYSSGRFLLPSLPTVVIGSPSCFPFGWIPADELRGYQETMVMPNIRHLASSSFPALYHARHFVSGIHLFFIGGIPADNRRGRQNMVILPDI